MDSPVKKLRKALGLSQHHFAMELGMSIASVQNYERGIAPSESALKRIQDLAVRNGLADIALELGPMPRPVMVFQKEDLDAGRLRLPEYGGGANEMSRTLHAMLDRILQSGDSDAIGAIESLLQLIAQLVTRKGR